MVLGLDISKRNFDAALLSSSPGGTQTKPRHKAFPNTPAGFQRLQEWLGSTSVHACLEATGTYGDALARFLHDKGHTVSSDGPLSQTAVPAERQGLSSAVVSWPKNHTDAASGAEYGLETSLTL
jgi:hypothetical protein